MEFESESEYGSESERSKRDSTWPGTESSIFDEPLSLPQDYSKSVILQTPARKARPSSTPLFPIGSQGNKRKARFVPVRVGTPWESYEQNWQLGRRNKVIVAYKISEQCQIYTVREVSKSKAGRSFEIIRQFHHKNLVPIHEVFASQQGFFIICPYMDISLERINGSPRYPCETQLAELSCEVLDGISYLASEGWTHGNISCSNILLSLKDVGRAKISEVKITDIECCSESERGDIGRVDSKALGIVMMKVMEKDSQPEGSFGLRHPECWSKDAVEFLSMTQVSTPEKLLQHQFVTKYKRCGSLVRLIAFTNVAAFGGFYDYDQSAKLF